MRRFGEVVREGLEASSRVNPCTPNLCIIVEVLISRRSMVFLPPRRFSTLNLVSPYCLYFFLRFQFLFNFTFNAEFRFIVSSYL